MPRKMTGKKVHYSMQGKPVDFEAIRTKHEKTKKKRKNNKKKRKNKKDKENEKD